MLIRPMDDERIPSMVTPMTPSDQPIRGARTDSAMSVDGSSECLPECQAQVPVAQIGTLNEGSLHASLKEHYAEPGDAFEVPMEGFVIDIVRAQGRPDELLIEIQTGSFGAMGKKFDQLLTARRILLVHPIAIETVLHKPDARPRRSPKRGTIYSLFDELVSIPTLLDHPNLELEIVLVRVAKHQVKDPKARRRRGGFRTVDRTLEAVLETRRFRTIEDLLKLVPADLPEIFTTADLAATGVVSRDEAQRLAYCLKACGLFETINRTKAGYRYRLACEPSS